MAPRSACFERKKEKYVTLWQNMHSLDPGHHDQVGNGYRFIGDFFTPKWGIQFIFGGKKRSNREVKLTVEEKSASKKTR